MTASWSPALTGPMAKASGSARELYSAHPVTVLIVEDDDRLRAMARRVIGGQGYRVIEALNGADALVVAAREGWRIDLVLTDVDMPTIGVRAMVRQLSQLCPGVRTVFMSGHADEELLARGFDKGHDLFLEKPFSGVELVESLHEALRMSAV